MLGQDKSDRSEMKANGAEGSGDFVVAQDFRRVGLVRNPYNHGTTTVATGATLSGLKSVTFNSSPTPGTFTNDEVITGGTSGAKGKVVNWDSTNRILKYIQTEWTGIDSVKNLTAFAKPCSAAMESTDSPFFVRKLISVIMVCSSEFIVVSRYSLMICVVGSLLSSSIFIKSSNSACKAS